jgi:titin
MFLPYSCGLWPSFAVFVICGSNKEKIQMKISYTFLQALVFALAACVLMGIAACAAVDDGGGNSSASGAAAAPAAPSGVQATALSARRVSVSWNTVAGAANYKIFYMRESVDAAPILSGSGNTAPYTCAGLNHNTAYLFFVKAVNSHGESLYSDPGAARTQVYAVSGVTATALSASSIRVSWNSAPDTTKYKVYYSIGSTGASRSLAADTVTANTFTHTGLTANTLYYYSIVAVDSIGESDYSAMTDVASAATRPAAPTGVTAAALSAASISVTWNAVTGAAEYKIYSAASGTGTKTLLGAAAATGYTHTGLSAGTTYYYFVAAISGSGESDYSAYTSAITLPAVPAGVTAAAASAASISISWTAVTGAANYKVYFAESSDGAKTLAGTVTGATNYSHTGLSPNTAYYYYVAAANASGESDFSARVSAITKPPVPTGVTAAAVSASDIQITWHTAAGAASYKVYVAASSTGAKSLAGTTAETSFVHTGRQAGTAYYYFVVTVIGGNESDYSAAASAIMAPPAPTGVTATAQSADSIRISWSAATGAASYKVYYAQSAEGDKSLAGTVTGGTSFTHTGLPAATACHYFIIAVNVSGESGYSQYTDLASASTKPLAPAGVTATALSTTGMQITWSAVPGAASYKVYYRKSADSASTRTLAGTAGGTTYTHSGLTADVYNYYVTTVAASGESDYSVLTDAAIMPPKPQPPTNLIADTQFYMTSDFIWAFSPVPTATSYRMYENTVSASAAKEFGGEFSAADLESAANEWRREGFPLSPNAYAMWELTEPNKTYYIWVTAVNKAGESAYSVCLIQKAGPAAPTGVTATALTAAGQIRISWNAVSGATSYKLFEVINGTYYEEQTITGTNFTLTGYRSGSTHSYVVQALNANGQSDVSAAATATAR